MKNGWILFMLVLLTACGHTASQQQPEEATVAVTDLIDTFEAPENIKEVGCSPWRYFYTDAQCRASVYCKVFGACTFDESHWSHCIATSDLDCESSEQCVSEGYCIARDGMCVSD